MTHVRLSPQCKTFASCLSEGLSRRGPYSTPVEFITGSGGPSTATVAESPNFADVTGGAAVAAGGLGLSSGSTAIPFASLDSNDISGSDSLTSPSPNNYSCPNVSPMMSFTLASETVLTKISDIIKHKQLYLNERIRGLTNLRKMNESLWDIRENNEAFLQIATDSTIYYIRQCYREVYSILDEMF